MINRLTNNFSLKLVSVVFASMVWLYVVGEEKKELGLLLKPGFISIPENLLLEKTPDVNLDVRLRGPEKIVENISPSDITLDFDLSDTKAGKNTVIIKDKDVKLPRGVEVVSIRPRSVDIFLEALIKDQVKIFPYIKGLPGKGYKLGQVKVEPEEVEVEAYEKDFKEIKRIETEEIDITGLNKTTSFEIDLKDTTVGIRKMEKSKVIVTIEIIKKKSKRKNK